jgi:hypothetical protein
MLALSQLSYGPLEVSQSSRGIEIVRPIDPTSLVVSARIDPQRNRRAIRNPVDRDQEATIQFHAVRGDRIYLIGRVVPSTEPVGTPTRALAGHDDDTFATRGPFALHAQELVAEIQDQVVSPAFRDRLVDVDTQLHGRGHDERLRNCSFLIRCHPSQRSGRIGWAVSAWDNRDTGYTAAKERNHRNSELTRTSTSYRRPR